MAVYTLPNGSEYDTNLDWGHQSSGSQEFWLEVQETTTPIQTTEQTRNPNRNRVLKEVYTNTSYSGSNYIITINNIFMIIMINLTRKINRWYCKRVRY